MSLSGSRFFYPLSVGHDTTASAISWAIYCLAKYPKEQEKVHQEVTSVLNGRTQLTWYLLFDFSYF